MNVGIAMNLENATDKELLEGIINGNIKSFNHMKQRYDPRLKSIFYKRFMPIERALSYSLDVLYEDFVSMVLADLLVKPLEALTFDTSGSIGGLIHKIASDKSNDIWKRAINHRSKDSTATRMQEKQKALASGNERPKESDTKSYARTTTNYSEIRFDFGFSEFDENEVETEGRLNNSPEKIHIAEDLKLKFLNRLSEKQQKIVEFRALGMTQECIAVRVELTKDQVRTQLKKIDDVLTQLQKE